MFCININQIYDAHKKRCIDYKSKQGIIYMKRLKYCTLMHNKNMRKCKIITKYLGKRQTIKNILVSALISFTLALLYIPLKKSFIPFLISNINNYVKKKTKLDTTKLLEDITLNIENIKTFIDIKDTSIKVLNDTYNNVIDKPYKYTKDTIKNLSNALYERTDTVLTPFYSDFIENIDSEILNKNPDSIPGAFPKNNSTDSNKTITRKNSNSSDKTIRKKSTNSRKI